MSVTQTRTADRKYSTYTYIPRLGHELFVYLFKRTVMEVNNALAKVIFLLHITDRLTVGKYII